MDIEIRELEDWTFRIGGSSVIIRSKFAMQYVSLNVFSEFIKSNEEGAICEFDYANSKYLRITKGYLVVYELIHYSYKPTVKYPLEDVQEAITKFQLLGE